MTNVSKRKDFGDILGQRNLRAHEHVARWLLARASLLRHGRLPSLIESWRAVVLAGLVGCRQKELPL